jgi:hypothetical protein
MIKEFWQERKEEKLKQKQLKKQNKKLPKTKEERAYKIFGLFFALFLIFGSVFTTCRSTDGIEDYSWDILIGVSDEMKEKLSHPVDKQTLIQDKELSVVDWSECRDAISLSGLDVFTNEEFDLEKLLDESCKLENRITLKDNMVGALVTAFTGTSSSDVKIIEVNIYQDGIVPMMTTLMYINLSKLVLSSTLPHVYMTTTSRLEIQNNKLYCLDTEIIINDFNEEDNEEALEILGKSSLLGLDYLTNELIAREINSFADVIKADVDISGVSIRFEPINE